MTHAVIKIDYHQSASDTEFLPTQDDLHRRLTALQGLDRVKNIHVFLHDRTFQRTSNWIETPYRKEK